MTRFHDLPEYRRDHILGYLLPVVVVAGAAMIVLIWAIVALV